MTDYRVLITVEQLVASCEWLTEPTIRMWIKRADELGLAHCIIRPTPKRVLIDPDAFNEWLESRRLSAALSASS